jgi:ribosomal protein S18 acetylase RimI-like enzyme
MDITIRTATAEDYDELCGLVDQVDRLHREHVPEVFRKPDGPVRERAYLDGLLADESAAIFLAVVDGRAAGALVALLRDAAPIPILVPRRVAVVDNLVVDESLRGMGVGRALMVQAEAWAVQHGASALELSVHEFNRHAIDFYESLGYATTTRRMSKRLRG